MTSTWAERGYLSDVGGAHVTGELCSNDPLLLQFSFSFVSVFRAESSMSCVSWHYLSCVLGLYKHRNAIYFARDLFQTLSSDDVVNHL